MGKTLINTGSSWVEDCPYEYYDGDLYSSNLDQGIDFNIDQAIPIPYPVTLVSSQKPYAFCRSWNHIRGDTKDLLVLRYVKSGTFFITQMGRTSRVKPGQFVFTRSTVPCRWETESYCNEKHEYYFVLLPSSLMHHYFPAGVPLNVHNDTEPNDNSPVIAKIFDLLHKQGSMLKHNVARQLVMAILEEISNIVRKCCHWEEDRKSLSNERAEEIIAYINLHISNPNLSLSSVAHACHISKRYLCYLMKMNNTSFSDMLWQGRLKRAESMLSTQQFNRYSISKIAFMAGFKTAAHFSRLFKQCYQYSPREYRNRCDINS